jgi:four helix bundle protein
MDVVKAETEGERHVRAFRATDAFALEAFQAARGMGREDGEGLAREIRRVAARSGGALVAASAAGSGEDRRSLELARAGLLELRYYLYLARRLGLLDLKKYRHLAVRQDTALREIDGLIGARERPPP